MNRKPILTIALLIAAVTIASAQGGGGQRGFGGRGMMGGGQSDYQLLTRADVEKELVITADQKTKLAEVRKTAADEMRAKMEELRSGGGQPDMEKMREEMTKFQKGVEDKYNKVLTKEQAKRLHELGLQRRGARALADPKVQEELKFTEDQKTKVKDLQAKQQEANQSIMEKQRNQELTREEATAAREKNTKALEEELKKVLTAEQTKQFADMQGKPFKFDPEIDKAEAAARRGGPGGGGGRGGGGGGGGL